MDAFEAGGLSERTKRIFTRDLADTLRETLRTELAESPACAEVILLGEESKNPDALGSGRDVVMEISVWSGGWYVPDQEEHDDVLITLSSLGVLALAAPPYSFVLAPLVVLAPALAYTSLPTDLHAAAQLVVKLKDARWGGEVLRTYVGESVSTRSIYRTFENRYRRHEFQRAYLDALRKLREDLPSAVHELEIAGLD